MLSLKKPHLIMDNQTAITKKAQLLILAAILAPMALSVICWLVPGEGLFERGFSRRSEITLQNISVLAIWVASLCLVSYCGIAIGGRFGRRRACPKARFDYKWSLLALEVIATIGLLSAYAPSDNIIDSIASGQMNLVSRHLRGGAGLGSLRYAAISAAAMSIILFLEKRNSPVRLILDCFLLLMQALLSSRMSLLIAMFIVITYFHMNHESKGRKRSILAIKLRTIALAFLVVLILFGLATFLNYSRNSNYYVSLGVTSPIEMNILQILSYFGAPTQVALAKANDSVALTTFVTGEVNYLNLIIPTFFQKSANGGQSIQLDYGPDVDVLSSLTTNSVFANVLTAYGVLGLAIVLAMYFIAALFIGSFINDKSIAGSIAVGAVGYMFLATWRVYLVPQGILLFVIMTAIVVLITRREMQSKEAQ